MPQFWSLSVHRIASLSQTARFVLGALTLVVVSVLDWLSGSELVFSLFYFLPLSLMIWKTPPRVSVLTCLVVALLWFLVERYTLASHISFAAAVWNGFIRFGVMLLIASLLHELQKNLAFKDKLAFTDPLTGLMNTRQFYKQAERFLARAKHESTPTCIAYIDLDNFKSINDEFGHKKGDEVLIHTTALIESQLRPTDSFARLGGDEFAICLPNCGAQAASTRMSQIMQAFAESPLTNLGLGMSMGAVCSTQSKAELDELISSADSLMYKVKKQGKNSFLVLEL